MNRSSKNVSTRVTIEDNRRSSDVSVNNDRINNNNNNQRSIYHVDGGYAWVIVLQAFIVSVLVDGSIYSFGIYLPVYMNEFNQGPSTIAWIGSLATGVSSGGGIFAGYLCDKYGNRIILIIGMIFISFGYLTGSLTNAVWGLFLTQGVLCGIGYSLAYNAGLSIVGQWFIKRRGLGLGLAVSGSGIGKYMYMS